MADKKAVVMYEEWARYLLALPLEQKGNLMDAIIRASYSEEYELDPMVAPFFNALIKPVIDDRIEKANDIHEKRVEAGREGGSKPKQTEAKVSKPKQTEAKVSKPKQTEALREREEKEIENEIENESEKENREEKKRTPHTPHGGRGVVKYSDDPELNQAVLDFIEHRKKLRRPMCDKAIELFMGRCAQLAPGDTIGQVKLINTAIERGWQTVYPPDDSKTRNVGSKGGGMDYLMSEMGRIKREQEAVVNDTG